MFKEEGGINSFQEDAPMRPTYFTRWVAIWLVVMETYQAQDIMGQSEWRAGWLSVDRLECDTASSFKDDTWCIQTSPCEVV